jgi:TetR/AcrR family transcriptional regulator, regulator of autoinduction and epiphytic fitness
MGSAVKGTRRYVSAKREEQARQTRREIVETAHRLFVARGYPATTIELIAQEAGVAIQTMYSSVGNKRDVLWAVLETRVAGDDAPRSLFDRFRDDLGGAADPRDRLGAAVRFGREVMERSADVHRIMQSAAGLDPEIAAALTEAERRRYRDASEIVGLIAGEHGFGPDMDARTAADLWFAVTSYEVYELLTGSRRWPPARYETWITAALCPLIAHPCS